jgi:hypothetical protein
VAEFSKLLLQLVGDRPYLRGALCAQLGDLSHLVVELVDVVEHGDAAQHHGHSTGQYATGRVQEQLGNLECKK